MKIQCPISAGSTNSAWNGGRQAPGPDAPGKIPSPPPPASCPPATAPSDRRPPVEGADHPAPPCVRSKLSVSAPPTGSGTRPGQDRMRLPKRDHPPVEGQHRTRIAVLHRNRMRQMLHRHRQPRLVLRRSRHSGCRPATPSAYGNRRGCGISARTACHRGPASPRTPHRPRSGRAPRPDRGQTDPRSAISSAR